MSNYASPPLGSMPYGASPYTQPGGVVPGMQRSRSPAPQSSYPGMNNAGIGAQGLYQPPQGVSSQTSAYPGMMGSGQQGGRSMSSPMMMTPGQQHQSYRSSPSLSGSTAVGGGPPPGVTLLRDQQQPQPFAPPPGGTIAPGSMTYLTTQDAQGRVTYHHFKAEPATYKSPQGITYNGIQWVGCGSSHVPPTGVSPAGPDLAASLNRTAGSYGSSSGYGGDYQDDGPAYREWGKEESKRRKKEEKEANKRAVQWDAQQRARERAEEVEFRKSQMRSQEDAELLAARERDAQREREIQMHQRSRRQSNASRYVPEGLGGDVGSNIYGEAPVGAGVYERPRSVYGGDVERERPRSIYGGDVERERPRSVYGGDVERTQRPRSVYGDVSAERELERRMADMNVSGGGLGSHLSTDYGAPPLAGIPGGVRSRRGSMNMPAASIGGMRGSAYDDSEAFVDRDYDRPERDDYLGAGTVTRLGGGGGGLGRPSPYRSTSPLPPSMNASGVSVYPPGHIYEGMPITGAAGNAGSGLGVGLGSGGAISRNHSPIPGTAPYSAVSGYGGASPRMAMRDALDARDQQLLATPDGFSRPVNRAQTFTPFDMMKIQDVDDFLRIIPRFPLVLSTHDVLQEDWGRFMGDISLAWQERLPMPNTGIRRMPKRTTMLADLLDLWNHSFFLPRGIEIVLYKGRERRSGRGAGMRETRLGPLESDSSISSDLSSEDEFYSDLDLASRDDRNRHYGLYGRHDDRLEKEMRESRTYRRQRKAEKKRMKQHRKLTRKVMNKVYTLYMCYVPPRETYGVLGTSFGGGGGYSGSGYASSGHGL